MDSTSENDRTRLINSARELLDKVAVMVVNNFEDSEAEHRLEKLRNTAYKYCESERDWKVGKESLQEMERTMYNEDNPDDLDFDEVYVNITKIKKEKNQNDNLRNYPYYKEFEAKLRETQDKIMGMETDEEVDEVEEEDLVGTQVQISFKDPFTRQIMQHPMKNKNCGHYYDRVAVISMLRGKKMLRCPYACCKARVVENDLVEDLELLKQIQESQNAVEADSINVEQAL